MYERLIDLQARLRPQAIAITRGDEQFTFAQLAADIGRCSHWLAGLDAPPGARALLQVPHPYLHWVMAFALDQAGLTASVVLRAEELPAAVNLLRAELVFSSQAPETPLGVPTHRLDQAWLDGLAVHPASWRRRRPRTPQDPCRILVTSGTTGSPKKILLTREMMDRRVANLVLTGGYSRPAPRVLSELGVSSIGGLMISLVCWAQGGTLCHLGPGETLLDALDRRGLNLVMLAPFSLQQLLRAVAADRAPDPDLVIAPAGGSLSAELVAQTRRRLTPNLTVCYGATETGVAVMGRMQDMAGSEEASGLVYPWAEVEILDDQGVPAPPGQAGEIRLRSDELIEGYLEDPAASAEMFRDGWFWPGDLGVLSSAGLLTVVGRTNELMNIGGVKFLASRLEALVQRVEGVLDAGVFVAPDADGLDTAHVAYVAAGDLDLTPLKMIIERALGGREPRLLRVDEIPRNAMSKIQRDALRRMHADAAR